VTALVKPDLSGAGGDRRPHDRRRGHREVEAVVLAEGFSC
jgi:hypothetical protein